MAPMLDALRRQLPGVGRRRRSAVIAIVDWREVPTWTEFEILRDAFTDARRADARVRSA